MGTIGWAWTVFVASITESLEAHSPALRLRHQQALADQALADQATASDKVEAVERLIAEWEKCETRDHVTLLKISEVLGRAPWVDKATKTVCGDPRCECSQPDEKDGAR